MTFMHQACNNGAEFGSISIETIRRGLKFSFFSFGLICGLIHVHAYGLVMSHQCILRTRRPTTRCRFKTNSLFSVDIIYRYKIYKSWCRKAAEKQL